MPPGVEVGLGTGHIVMGDPAPPPKKVTAPNFRPMYVVTKQLDDQDATWYRGRP